MSTQDSRLQHIRYNDVIHYVNKDGSISSGTVRGWKTDNGKPRLLVRNHGELVKLSDVVARIRQGIGEDAGEVYFADEQEHIA